MEFYSKGKEHQINKLKHLFINFIILYSVNKFKIITKQTFSHPCLSGTAWKRMLQFPEQLCTHIFFIFMIFSSNNPSIPPYRIRLLLSLSYHTWLMPCHYPVTVVDVFWFWLRLFLKRKKNRVVEVLLQMSAGWCHTLGRTLETTLYLPCDGTLFLATFSSPNENWRFVCMAKCDTGPDVFLGEQTVQE